MKTTSLIAGALVAGSQFMGAFAQEEGKQPKKEIPTLGKPTAQGCFSSKGNFTKSGVSAAATSSGSCNKWCKEEGWTAFALSTQNCVCGLAYPPEDTLTDDDKCNYPCPGYGLEACGGLGNPVYWSVYNAGVEINVPFYEEEEEDEDEDEETTTSSAAPSATSATNDDDQTTGAPDSTNSSVPTESSDPSQDSGEEDKGPNVTGIVVGVVVGIVVVAGACGGLFFYMRRKRNTEIEEEHRRNAAVNAFISGSKPPGSSGSISVTDSRLDPVMGHRRMSNGSIADNEDYSRKILRVTNA